MNEELSLIKKDVNEFKAKFNEKYEVIKKLLDFIDNLTEDTYPDVILLIKNHSDIFFKDHPSAILFFSLIIHSCLVNFKRFELNLNIILDFSNEIKSTKTTENELIQICLFFFKSVYYLFSHNFFSIESIIEQSITVYLLFIYFWPEIDQNDHEYAIIKEKDIYQNQNDPQIKKEIDFFDKIKANPEIHFLNRKNSYHPSSLHKSIREDDIESFQSILSKNNIGFNYVIEYSFYERAPFLHEDLSLIQIAAIYGSIKIFKFLMIQNENIIKKNLLKCAYFGRNHEIIHLCENIILQEKNIFHKNEKVYLEPIKMHQNDLLAYYIDNFSDQIKEDEDVEKLLTNFVYEENDEDEENDCYKYLNYKSLIIAAESFNYRIILNCLDKIVFIAKKIELVEQEMYLRFTSFLNSFEADLDLHNFIYSQKIKTVNKLKCGCYLCNLYDCMNYNMNDAFKFVFFDMQNAIYLHIIFQDCISCNHDIANFILDHQLDENMKGKLKFYEKLNQNEKMNDLIMALKFFNENLVVKIIKLFDVLKNENDITKFVTYLKDSISTKMICSLLIRIASFLPKNQLVIMSSLFDDEKYQSVACIINEQILKENKD